jgi:glycosyltransferase involved in cell wall biosynthesis
MRLLFVNYEFPPVGGGAAYASLATARELVAMGHRVDFLTAATPGASRDHEIDGVRVFRVRCYRRGVHDIGILGALTFVAFAAPRLRALARENHYDVCHYYFGLPTGLLSCVPGAHRDRPYIISLRGSDVPGYSVNLRRYHRFLLPITRRIWHRAHRVLANSQDLRRLAQASVPAVRIDVILNGAATSSAARSPRAPGAPVRVLTVSRLIERKGLDTLIKAVALSSDRTLHLDIAGEGPEGAVLQRLARSCGVADRVRFLGFVDRLRLSSLYAHIDMFALVSRAESCSMAMLEAMAAGLPVIATRVGGNVELIQHERNGLLVDPGNVETLARALSALAADPQQRLRFGACNRALVEQRFGWRAVAQRYESVFRETVCSPVEMAVEPDAELSILQPPTGTDA